MKIFKVIIGVISGWFCGSILSWLVLNVSGQSGTHFADVTQVSTALIGSILGGLISYKKLAKYKND